MPSEQTDADKRHRLTTPELRDERAARGFCSEDVWSLDGYLAWIIANSVRELADMSHGYPSAIAETIKDGDAALEEWRVILATIAQGFASYAETDERSPEFERAFDLLREWWGALWD